MRFISNVVLFWDDFIVGDDWVLLLAWWWRSQSLRCSHRMA